jgi:hypothetical protein
MYRFRLERTDGSPADPPTYRSTVLSWRQGDQIPLNATRTLRVLGVRDDDVDQPPALVVVFVFVQPPAVATAEKCLLPGKLQSVCHCACRTDCRSGASVLDLGVLTPPGFPPAAGIAGYVRRRLV